MSIHFINFSTTDDEAEVRFKRLKKDLRNLLFGKILQKWAIFSKI